MFVHIIWISWLYGKYYRQDFHEELQYSANVVFQLCLAGDSKKQQKKHPGFSNRNQNLPGKYYPLP